MNNKVLILMPVYNAAKYLKEAIESILNQTFEDFEFLIIDDGSTDKSAEIIKTYNDPRIKFMKNKHNVGLIRTLNKGLKLAESEYIARMDADDISTPDRLQKQVEFMDENPETGICGCKMEVFGYANYICRYPESYEEIKASFIFINSLPHPGVIIRKSFLDKYKLSYSKEYVYCEDYELWTRAVQLFPIRNHPDILLKYRSYNNSERESYIIEQRTNSRKVRYNYLGCLDLKLTDKELILIDNIIMNTIESKNEMQQAEDLFEKIKNKNLDLKIFDDKYLNKIIENYLKQIRCKF